jgi:hypothetical protein
MRLRRPNLELVALALASAFGLAGHFSATAFIHDQQARQLDAARSYAIPR